MKACKSWLSSKVEAVGAHPAVSVDIRSTENPSDWIGNRPGRSRNARGRYEANEMQSTGGTDGRTDGVVLCDRRPQSAGAKRSLRRLVLQAYRSPGRAVYRPTVRRIRHDPYMYMRRDLAAIGPVLLDTARGSMQGTFALPGHLP